VIGLLFSIGVLHVNLIFSPSTSSPKSPIILGANGFSIKFIAISSPFIFGFVAFRLTLLLSELTDTS